jgi:hypothetical protein
VKIGKGKAILFLHTQDDRHSHLNSQGYDIEKGKKHLVKSVNVTGTKLAIFLLDMKKFFLPHLLIIIFRGTFSSSQYQERDKATNT